MGRTQGGLDPECCTHSGLKFVSDLLHLAHELRMEQLRRPIRARQVLRERGLDA